MEKDIKFIRSKIMECMLSKKLVLNPLCYGGL